VELLGQFIGHRASDAISNTKPDPDGNSDLNPEANHISHGDPNACGNGSGHIDADRDANADANSVGLRIGIAVSQRVAIGQRSRKRNGIAG
jgi:hypothetical protein